MAEAVAEPQTAPVVEKRDATNGSNESPKAASKNGAEVSEKKQSNGKRDREEDEDDYERYDNGKSDKRERHDRDDRRGRDGDRRGGGKGWARGGGKNRGFRGGARGGARGGFDRDNRGYRKDNVRTKYERQEESSDAAEIRRQVEFYFSSSNLPVDKFLLEETGGPENKWFSLKTLHNFKRMRHFQPYSAVVEAVKGSELVEINDKDEIRRKVPIDSIFTLDVKKNNDILTTETMKRSIYAKGFGDEHTKTAFEIEEFFNPYGAKAVRLRRSDDGTFKGSAFIEFGSEDDAQQFLDMEEKPKFNDKELHIMGKKAYIDMKSQGILDGTVKPKSPTRQGDFRRNNRRGGDRRHSDRKDHRKPRRNSFDYGENKRKRDKDDDDVEDKDDWRSRRDKFQKKGDRSVSRSVSRSRSRSPYRAGKSDEKPTEESEEKPAEKSEEKSAEKNEEKTVEKTETADAPAAEKVAEAPKVNTNA